MCLFKAIICIYFGQHNRIHLADTLSPRQPFFSPFVSFQSVWYMATSIIVAKQPCYIEILQISSSNFSSSTINQQLTQMTQTKTGRFVSTGLLFHLTEVRWLTELERFLMDRFRPGGENNKPPQISDFWRLVGLTEGICLWIYLSFCWCYSLLNKDHPNRNLFTHFSAVQTQMLFFYQTDKLLWRK